MFDSEAFVLQRSVLFVAVDPSGWLWWRLVAPRCHGVSAGDLRLRGGCCSLTRLCVSGLHLPAYRDFFSSSFAFNFFFFFEITPSLGLCQVHFRCELGFPTLKAVFWFAYSVLLPLLAITLLGVIRGVLSFRCENVYALR